MKEEKFKCPICHISHNYLSKEFKNINIFKDKNILCYSCIKKILNEENNLTFPQNLFAHQISEIEEEKESENNDIVKAENNEIRHKLNKSLIDEIRRDSINKTLIQEMKYQNKNKLFVTNLNSPQSKLRNDKINLSIHSKSYNKINSSKNYYIKKKIKVNNNLVQKINLKTENEFMEKNNELDNIYNNVEKNQKIFNNFNQKFFNLIENINDKFIQLEGQINEIKNEIINKINNQFTFISNFINLRRKEIFDKFQYCNYDISDLINSSLKWMKAVKEEKKELNITKLINKGKKINEGYNLIQEINETFILLEEYEKNGITITKNELNDMPITIKENNKIIKLLNLTSYIEISKENKIKSNENSEIINNNTSTNIESTKIYCKKKINDNTRYNNTVSEFFKNKNNNNSFKSITHDKNNLTKNNSVNYNKISVTKIKNDINTDLNESDFPFIYNPNGNYALSSGNTSAKNDILEYRKRHESIRVNNTENNITNYNGHIFSYNSDTNTSIIFNEKDKNNENKKIISNYDSKNPSRGKNIQKKVIKNKFEKNKIKRCISFNKNKIKLNHSNKYIKININKKPRLTVNNQYNINNKIIRPILKENIINNNQEKSFTNSMKNKISKKSKYNYKTLNLKELEKYVNYQLKKLKQNFNRINLRDSGIKLICSYYRKNKNKIFKEIKLQGCHLNDKDLDLLINCLIENNITIPIINISDNELTDKSLKPIIKLINANEEISNLIMMNNSFTKQSKEKFKNISKNRKDELFELNIQI